MVLLYASMYNDVCNVVNISGRFDLKRGIEGRLGKDFLERIKQHGFIDVKNRRGELSNVISRQSICFVLNFVIILLLYGCWSTLFCLVFLINLCWNIGCSVVLPYF